MYNNKSTSLTQRLPVKIVTPLRYIILYLLVLMANLLSVHSVALAEPVQLLASGSGIAKGAGMTGNPSITNLTIPAGKNRILLVTANFERDHCDKSTDNCTNTNMGNTGDLADNFALETGSLAAGTVQVTAQLQSAFKTISKRNALVVGGSPSGDLRFANFRAHASSNGVEIANTTYYSMESYFIAFYESEISQVLNGAASGTINITLPNITTPRGAGDDAILTAYVFANAQQHDKGIVRSSISIVNSGSSSFAIAGDYTISPASYDVGDMPTNANDGFVVLGLSNVGYPSSQGGFNTMAGYNAIHTLTTTNSNGRFDTAFGTSNSEPDGLSYTAQFRNGLVSSYTLQSSAPSTVVAMSGWGGSFTIAAYNPDSSDAPSSYGVATHNTTGIRLGNSVDQDLTALSSTAADGDDSNASDDEEGVTLPSTFNPNITTTLSANIQSASGNLNAWIDWNRDGDFNDSGEQVLSDRSVAIGTSTFTINTPSTAVVGSSFARFRVCSSSNECRVPSGDAASGEVEDYRITITNIPPVITSNGGSTTAAMSLPEKQTAVTTVTATDANSDAISFSISGVDATKFTINAVTGVLEWVSAPNYSIPTDSDANNTYILTITATDSRGGVDTQTLTITVTNVNEPPTITSNGGGDQASVAVNENQVDVTTVTATDPESDKITFKMIGGADQALFNINAVSGVLTFAKAPNFEEPSDANADNVYEVNVEASDNNGGTDRQLLLIQVKNVIEDGQVRTKVFLQAVLDRSTLLMDDTLRSLKTIPLTQPYTYNAVNYKGKETVTNQRLSIVGNNAVVDWVLVELHHPNNPERIVARQAALLTRDGNIVDPATNNTVLIFKDIDSVKYYVAVRHRNHLGVMTDKALDLSIPNDVVVDFTDPKVATFGGAKARLNYQEASVLWGGDANLSNNVIGNGPNNDPVTMLGAVLLAKENTWFNTNYVMAGYSNYDIDMNGYTLLSGPTNDVNLIIGNILIYPDNTRHISNYVVSGSIPTK